MFAVLVKNGAGRKGRGSRVSHVDAVVIGSGPNGLMAANLLAEAGWEVVVLEAQREVGGAVHSDSSVLDGYVHDTFSSFYPLAAASPTIQALQLHRHGLEWSQAPAVVGTPLGDGAWALCTATVSRRPPAWTSSPLETVRHG
jgi:phytoene dehydrogenase-like protein